MLLYTRDLFKKKKKETEEPKKKVSLAFSFNMIGWIYDY